MKLGLTGLVGVKGHLCFILGCSYQLHPGENNTEEGVVGLTAFSRPLDGGNCSTSFPSASTKGSLVFQNCEVVAPFSSNSSVLPFRMFTLAQKIMGIPIYIDMIVRGENSPHTEIFGWTLNKMDSECVCKSHQMLWKEIQEYCSPLPAEGNKSEKI